MYEYVCDNIIPIDDPQLTDASLTVAKMLG